MNLRRLSSLGWVALVVLAAWAALAAWMLAFPVPEADRLAAFDPREASAADAGASFAATQIVVHHDVRDGSSWAMSAAGLTVLGDELSARDVRILEKNVAQPVSITARSGRGKTHGTLETGGLTVDRLVLSGSVEIAGPRGLAVQGEEVEWEPAENVWRSSQPARIRFASGGEMHRFSWFAYDIRKDVLEADLTEFRNLSDSRKREEKVP